MTPISLTRQTSTRRSGLSGVVVAIGLITGLVSPMAVQAQSARAEAPMAGHATHGNGTHHGGGDMKSMMKDMNDRMAGMTMTGDHDVDFARMMRIHHEGAIDMAEMELKNGKDASMRKLAQEVIRAQKKEIAILDRFLARHGAAKKGS